MTLPGQRKPSRLTAAQLGISVPDVDAPASDDPAESEVPVVPAQNTIYFGPPGVGKSYSVEQLTDGWRRHRTVFHPEYASGDFVGTYRPVVWSDPDGEVRNAAGETVHRPVNTFEFVPGPLVDALLDAHEHPGQPVALIIEEINRGDCAAIFGPFFQLLDRAPSGRSEYAITVDPTLAGYLAKNGMDTEGGVRFPDNLSLFATMNTADQGLFPMDAAFKRRWSWRSVELMAGAGKLEKVRVSYGNAQVPWTGFIGALNRAVLEVTENEDKQVGPWYVRFESGEDGERVAVVESDLRDKLLFYLWHDVFRNRRSDFFEPQIKRFDELQVRYTEHDLRAVLNEKVQKQLDGLVFEGEDRSSASGDTAEAPEEA